MKPFDRNWPEIKRRIRHANHILLCLDYDGTLTPIVKTPRRARLAGSTRLLLQKLNQIPRYTIAVVSGRALKDLRSRLGDDALIRAGNHGLELEGPGLRHLHPGAKRARPLLKKLGRKLKGELGGIPGILVEDKIFSLSVHFRQVKKSDVRRLVRAVHSATRQDRRQGKIALRPGLKVIEVRPKVEWDKGKIVEWLLKRLKRLKKTNNILPVYLGDDLTDEDAFRKLADRGITIRVGKAGPSSRAEYRLRGPDQVKTFLRELITLG